MQDYNKAVVLGKDLPKLYSKEDDDLKEEMQQAQVQADGYSLKASMTSKDEDNCAKKFHGLTEYSVQQVRDAAAKKGKDPYLQAIMENEQIKIPRQYFSKTKE